MMVANNPIFIVCAKKWSLDLLETWKS
jgi:hypothetical protein